MCSFKAVSERRGTTWSQINSGLTTPFISMLVIDPHDRRRLDVATTNGGVCSNRSRLNISITEAGGGG